MALVKQLQLVAANGRLLADLARAHPHQGRTTERCSGWASPPHHGLSVFWCDEVAAGPGVPPPDEPLQTTEDSINCTLIASCTDSIA